MNLTKTMKSDIRRKLVEKRFPSAEYEKLRAAIRQGLEADGPAKWKEAQMLASKHTKYIDKQCRIYIEGISLEDSDKPAWYRWNRIEIEIEPYAGLYDGKYHYNNLSFSRNDDGSIACNWGIDFPQPTLQAITALFDWVDARTGMQNDLEALLGGISSSKKLIELLPEAKNILDETEEAETGKNKEKDGQEKEIVGKIREIISKGGTR